MDDAFGQSGQLADLIEIGDAVFPEHLDAMIVLDVSIDGLFAVVGFESDVGCELAFEIEGDDLPFVGDGAGEIVDISSCGK